MTDNFDPLKHKDLKLTVKTVRDGATIEGVHVRNLKTNVDGRGDLTEIWSLNWQDPAILPIEHAYYNLTDKGVTKGWHWHTHTSSQYVCLAGKMQIVLIDLRADSPSFGHVNQFVPSFKSPQFIKVPPFVLKGWKALEKNSVIINLLSTKDTLDNFKIPVENFLPDIWQPRNE